MSTVHEPTSQTVRFGELDIEYDERLLTPREWTLAQSDWAGELMPLLPEGPVVELCSGAGHIGLHAVLASPRRLVCVDDDEVACSYARRNAEAAGLADRVEVRNAGLEDALAPGERFALVIADPPWVPTDAVGRFPHDPVPAIDGGADGLHLVRRCLAVAGAHVLPGGSVLLQVGPGQDDTVGRESVGHGLALLEVRRAGSQGSLMWFQPLEGEA